MPYDVIRQVSVKPGSNSRQCVRYNFCPRSLAPMRRLTDVHGGRTLRRCLRASLCPKEVRNGSQVWAERWASRCVCGGLWRLDTYASP